MYAPVPHPLPYAQAGADGTACEAGAGCPSTCAIGKLEVPSDGEFRDCSGCTNPNFPMNWQARPPNLSYPSAMALSRCTVLGAVIQGSCWGCSEWWKLLEGGLGAFIPRQSALSLAIWAADCECSDSPYIGAQLGRLMYSWDG